MLGETLKMFRAIHGYKANELAELLEISPSYLSEIENDKKKPNLQLLEKYSTIFNVKISTLFLFSEKITDEAFGKGARLTIRDKLFRLMKFLESQGEPVGKPNL